MSMNNFTIIMRPISEELCIFEIQNELTATAETELMEAFSQATATGTRIIVFDFGRMTYLNSAGIGLLVRIVIRAQRQEQLVLAFGLIEHYRRIFELTRLQEVIRVYDTETEALASLEE